MYNWNYETLGGNTRVRIAHADDIRHLGELDQKMWTVLSCPVDGLEIPAETLSLMDSDNDGKLRVNEVVATAKWLTAVIKNADVLFERTATIRVADLDADNAEAQQMIQLIHEIQPEAEQITLAEVMDAIAKVTDKVAPAVLKDAPACPVDGGVLAAYHDCKEANNTYFETLRLEKLGLKKADPETAPAITEADWQKLCAQIDAYEAEAAAVAAANQAAQDAVAAAVAAAAAAYQPLVKLLRLKENFITLLHNYITFEDFFRIDRPAIFQCGRLVIDQRECSLCVRVQDAGAMAAQAGASGMYLLFCDCENKPTGKKLSIIAAMTAGDIRNLAVGKNAIFYDRNGLDYDAKVTKIIDNPISVAQAFWSPYKKFANWVNDLITKSVAEKESKGLEDMKANAAAKTEEVKADASTPDKKAASSFDIAKFAGIFAAIGMAVGYIGAFFTSLATGIAALTWWQFILAIIGIMLCISGPSMLLAYFKLRRRNLAPILNANGWAVNAEALINVPFGDTLTQTAKFPLIKMKDPFAEGTPAWKKVLRIVLALALLCGIALGICIHMGVCPCCAA